MARDAVGRALRFLRLRAGWRQVDLAGRARTSRETISRAERGSLDSLTLGSLRRIAGAVGATMAVELRWNGERLERLMDVGHASLQELTVQTLRAGRWTAEVEVSFNWYGDRGRYDALAFHAPTGTLLVVEVKTRLVDVQDTLGRLDVKLRLGPLVARQHRWPTPRQVVPCLVIAEGRTARRIVATHPSLFARFDVRGRDARRWLADPAAGGASGLLVFESLPDSRKTAVRGPRSRPTSPDSHEDGI
jgi:transcriptional regulator with XRE-family HTH domain